jgi:hypothetical protein
MIVAYIATHVSPAAVNCCARARACADRDHVARRRTTGRAPPSVLIATAIIAAGMPR